jgi:hypothetical protein
VRCTIYGLRSVNRLWEISQSISDKVYCIAQYISAELDYTSPGDRGIGRVSTHIPRFGAYFRKPLAQLSDDNRDELHNLIQTLVLRGYLVSALFSEPFVSDTSRLEQDILYQKWIPIIYVESASVPDNVLKLLGRVTDSTYARLSSFLISHRLRRGGLFSRDKTFEITLHYPIAGYLLRFVETDDY